MRKGALLASDPRGQLLLLDFNIFFVSLLGAHRRRWDCTRVGWVLGSGCWVLGWCPQTKVGIHKGEEGGWRGAHRHRWDLMMVFRVMEI